MGYVGALDSSKLTFLRKFLPMGFKIDADSISAVGFLEGYRFTISIEGFDYMISTSVRSGGLLPEESFLKSIKDEVHTITEAVFQNNRITFKIKKSLLSSTVVGNIIDSMHSVADILRRNGYINVCEICGEPEESIESYDINGRIFDLCDNCHESCDSYVQARKCLDDCVVENFFKGIAYSLILGLAASAIMVLFLVYGGISAYFGALLGLCLIIGYEAGSGKMSKFGLIYCGSMSVVLSYLSCRLATSIRFVRQIREFGESERLFDVFMNLHSILAKYSLNKDFFELVLYCLLASLVFIGADILVMLDKRRNKKLDVIIEIPEEDRFYNAG